MLLVPDFGKVARDLELHTLVRQWSVEIVEELAGQAEANLRQLGCSDVAIRIGDGSRGWREHAPYDRALLTAAAERLPPAILDQIKPRGRIVLPRWARTRRNGSRWSTKGRDRPVFGN